jgi:sortase (surface protein transpeptidase)
VAAVVAFTCAAIGVGSLAYATHDTDRGPQAPPVASPTAATTPSTHQRAEQSLHLLGPVMARSVPSHLAIPSLKIETNLLRLGLNADGSLQVPWKPLLAGWYQGSPTPGQLGPAIIAGHVDSWATGPAVFYHLGEVVVGAHVLVTRADTSIADFRVTAVISYPKAAFPTHQVYGDVNRAELRLITCANWNSTTQEYDNNVVVFARLART